MNTINDLLARGNIEKIKSNIEIKKANDYLTRSSVSLAEKPEWLDEFIKGNAATLREIICRSAGEKGFLQTQHYNEGYFNEIIQNANDLHVGDQIEIAISKSDDTISVKCVYKDRGFKIQDIYGFCKNGMSGKGEEHTGKFGIGIKALFSFVDTFKITSNMIFEFSNLNDLDNLQQTFWINNEWDGEHTILEFTFNVQKETVFNIKKLARLAQLLEDDYEEKSECLVELFTSSSYSKLLFDVHSLLFTDIQLDSHINKIRFNNKLLLQCEIMTSQDIDKAKVKKKKVSIIYKDMPALYEKVVTLFYKEKMVFGFDETNNENRLYSMFYLKNIKNHDIRNVGLYIHTPYTNPSRSDLGENVEEIEKRINKIREQLADLLLNIAEGQKSSSFYNEIASEFFHKCLGEYQDVSILELEKEQFNQKNIFYKCVEAKESNKELLKLRSTSKLQYYIVQETNNELYKQEYRPFEKEGTKKKLIQCYEQVIEKNEVLTLQELLNSNHVNPYVRRLYDALGNVKESENESNEWVRQMLNYYPNVASLIKYRINPNGDMDAESIANWLDEGVRIYGKEMEDYLQKLLGRYTIHPSFTKHGMIKHNQLQLVDYLFMQQNVTPKNRFGELLIENYDKQFADLKNVLHRNLTTDVIYYSPYGPSLRKWEGRYRCVTHVKNSGFIEPEFLACLIDALNTDSSADNQLWNHFSCIDNHLVLCKSILRNFTVDNKQFTHNEIHSTTVIGMNFLKNLKANELTQLFLYQDVADRINQAVNSKSYSEKLVKVEAHFKKITIKQLEQLLTWLLARTKQCLSIPPITIDTIEADNGKNLCEPAKLNILEPLLGADIFQGELGIIGENGKHLVVYVKKGVIKYMLGANSEFKELASTLSKTEEDTVYIFGSENLDPTKTLDYVLGDIKDASGNAIGNDTKEVIKSIISIKTIGQTISSKQYEELNTVYCENNKPRYRSISLNLANYSDFCNNLQIKKQILLARGSYNHQCPRCSKPIDHPEQVGIFIIPQEKHDYKGLACWGCIDILKAGLTKVVYNEQEQYLDLYCKFHFSEYQSQPKFSRIYVSPINKQLF
ncbi:hypothetical protein [Ureibacillus xyleni]|nr:hypothetical protein [Ureibacillus xyleni]